MKKIISLILLLLVFQFSIFAQQQNSKKMTLSAGYGIGNVWLYFLKNKSLLNYSPDYKVSSIGPFSICAEYFINKKISLGVSAAYSVVKGETKRFLVDEQISIFSTLARANYHFRSSKKLDPYLGGGLGYVRSAYKNSTSISGPVPGEFGYSAQAGAHYYITKKAGIYAELGYVNGSFFQTGFLLAVY